MPTSIPPESITVAIFCALTIESVAIRHSFDERYESHPIIAGHGQQNYVYNYGRIGDHKVVLARPHQMGPVKAALCAATVAQQFPSVRFALMVGIGGGIPSPKADIRLGDVAVSIPKDGHPGVIQYDYGKFEKDGKFVLKGSLDKPPGILVSADGSLEEDEEMDESPLYAILEGIANKKGYARPSSADILFEASFQHINEGEDCSGCLASDHKIATRGARDRDIKVHRGLILSGGGVVKNQIDRDNLRRGNDRAICFEMEAAGIMDQIPCLVIRGICDYADTHKNDDWHRYAAAVAAAYGKAILTKIHGEVLKQTARMSEFMEAMDQNVKEVGSDLKDLRRHAEQSVEAKQRKEILKWLREVDWSHHLFQHLESREPGTGQWVLNSAEFQQWLEEHVHTLLCYGLPGAGKTIIASIIIDFLRSKIHGTPTQDHEKTSALVFVFCSFHDRERQKAVHILLSLWRQLIEQHSSLTNNAEEFYINNISRPLESISIHDVTEAILQMSNSFTRIYVILDALDECEELSKLLPAISQIQKRARVGFLATSRPEKRIESLFGQSLTMTIRAAEPDVKQYLKNRMSNHKIIKDECEDFQESVKANLITRVPQRIVEVADGIFLLARFHMDAVMEATSPNGILNTVKSLPRGPDAYREIYGKTIQRIGNQASEYRSLAKRTFQWLMCAARPLSFPELREALAVKIGSTILDNMDVNSTDAMIEACKGLVVVDKDQGVRLLHHTTREYLNSHFGVFNWLDSPTISVLHLRFTNTEGASAEVAAQRYIALACLSYLSFDSFACGACRTQEEFDQRLLSYKLYGYAACYWGVHLRSCSDHTSHASDDTILRGFILSRPKVEASSQPLFLSQGSGYFRLDSGMCPQQMTSLHLVGYLGVESLAAPLLSDHPVDQKDSRGRTALAYAAEEGHYSTCLTLLEAGADEDSRDLAGRTPLSLAAEQGHCEIAQVLIQRGANVETRYFDDTPLILATIGGHLSVVECLITRQVEIEAKGYLGRTALLHACRIGYADVARVLLKNHANMNAVEADGSTPVLAAVRANSPETVKLLIDFGADVDQSDKDGNSPLTTALDLNDFETVGLLLNADQCEINRDLRHATSLSHTRLVQFLLDRGANPNLRDEVHMGPLEMAASCGHVDVARLLLDRGVDVDGPLSQRICPLHLDESKEKDLSLGPRPSCDSGDGSWGFCGQSALWIAVQGHHMTTAKMLLVRGANPNTADHHGLGKTPLHMCARACSVDVLEALLRKGAEVDAEDHQGNTPLFEVVGNMKRFQHAKHMQSRTARTLLENGANPNKTNRGGDAPILQACRSTYIDFMTVILERDADPNQHNEEYNMPFLQAYRDAKIDLLDLLLSKGADPNQQNHEGETPLMLACQLGELSLIRCLCQHGANPNQQNHEGETPLMLARRHYEQSLIQCFCQDTTDADIRNEHDAMQRRRCPCEYFKNVLRSLGSTEF